MPFLVVRDPEADETLEYSRNAAKSWPEEDRNQVEVAVREIDQFLTDTPFAGFRTEWIEDGLQIWVWIVFPLRAEYSYKEGFESVTLRRYLEEPSFVNYSD